jgi:hypothetical protein
MRLSPPLANNDVVIPQQRFYQIVGHAGQLAAVLRHMAAGPVRSSSLPVFLPFDLVYLH